MKTAWLSHVIQVICLYNMKNFLLMVHSWLLMLCILSVIPKIDTIYDLHFLNQFISAVHKWSMLKFSCQETNIPLYVIFLFTRYLLVSVWLVF